MAHRHRVHKAKGGRLAYAGAGSNVAHEAEEHSLDHKRGGRAKHHLGHVHGHKSKHRLDKRARGGGVGADRSPFSSAAHSGDHKRRSTGIDGHGPDGALEDGHGHAGKTKHLHPGHKGGSHPGHEHKGLGHAHHHNHHEGHKHPMMKHEHVKHHRGHHHGHK